MHNYIGFVNVWVQDLSKITLFRAKFSAQKKSSQEAKNFIPPWENDFLPPRTLKAYINDALHHLTMTFLTVFGHFKHQEAKIQPHFHKYVE